MAVSNFPVNFYADGINFVDAGVAKITWEKTSESIIDVDCWPPEVLTRNSFIHYVKQLFCMHKLCSFLCT